MRCAVCYSDNFEYDKKISAKCKQCDILYNLNAKPLSYKNGGGQDVPTKEKSNLRVKNALQRFKIIQPFITDQSIFIDIGCGSGEMLEVSKKYFSYRATCKFTKKPII